jgi:hypothetical protein
MLLRVLSWNVHKCIGGLDRRYDPARTARIVAESDPDVVLLQEVAQDGTRYRGEKQVDVLATCRLEHHSYSSTCGSAAIAAPTATRCSAATRGQVGQRRPDAAGRAALSAAPSCGWRCAPPASGRCTLSICTSGSARRSAASNCAVSWPRTRRYPLQHAGAGRRRLQRRLGIARPRLAAGRFRSGSHCALPGLRALRALDGLYVRGDLELVELRTLRAGSAHGLTTCRCSRRCDSTRERAGGGMAAHMSGDAAGAFA